MAMMVLVLFFQHQKGFSALLLYCLTILARLLVLLVERRDEWLQSRDDFLVGLSHCAPQLHVVLSITPKGPVRCAQDAALPHPLLSLCCAFGRLDSSLYAFTGLSLFTAPLTVWVYPSH